MWLTKAAVESMMAQLRAENTDLRQQLRLEREEWHKERLALLDRLLAVESPGALREARRLPEPPRPPHVESGRRRLNFPGRQTDLRPPSPKTPPAQPAPHDAHLADAATKIREGSQ